MFLSSLKIKNKIYTLTILASIFFIGSIFITSKTFDVLNKNFSNLANTNNSAKNYMNLTYEVEKLKRHVQNYTYTGYENSGIEAKNIYKNIVKLLDNTDSSYETDLQDNIKAIGFHLQRYYDTFLKVEEQRKKRDILKNQIRNNANLIQQSLYEYAQRSKDLKTQINILELYTDSFKIEKGVFSYFDSLNYEKVIESKKLLLNLKDKIEEYLQKETNPQRKEKLKEIRGFVSDYLTSFVKTVQHTRGYLSLINIVMAAEAYEIIYHSDIINKKAQNIINSIEKNFNDKIDQNSRNIIAIFLLFLIIMIVISVLIIKSIIKPLSSLTNTFNQLSLGKTDIELPKYNHINDEITELSNAALEFQKKSIETKKLLEEQEVLTDALFNKSEQLKVATQSAQIGIWTLDLKNKELILDDIMYKLYGLNKNEKIDDYSKWERCIHKDDFDHVKSLLFKSIIENQIIDTKFRIIKEDTKEIRYIKSYAVITKNGDEKPTHIIGVNYDITQFELLRTKLEKAVEEEVKKQREQEQVLIQQSKLAAMGEMISAISHQWRQPLNAVSLYLQDLISAQKYNELDTAYLKDNVSKCREQIEYMSSTIDDFRDFFNPTTTSENLNILDIVLKSKSLFEAQLKNNFISLELVYDKNETYQTFGNSNHLKQSIANILSNSIYAIKEKASIINDNSFEGKISIVLEKVNDEIKIKIIDNGSGIDMDVVNRVFEPYFTTKKEGDGSGIGLYMTRTILEKYFNGKISLVKQNEGVEVEIDLPIHLES